MKNTSISLRGTAVVLALVVLSGCAGMTTREKNTAVGAAIGGVAGNIIGGGSVLGTAAGAAAGGVIGHQSTKK
jgi:osmotically inducible lipoprotein OsmB